MWPVKKYYLKSNKYLDKYDIKHTGIQTNLEVNIRQTYQQKKTDRKDMTRERYENYTSE